MRWLLVSVLALVMVGNADAGRLFRRSASTPPAKSQPAAQQKEEAKPQPLTADEQHIVNVWRRLTPAQRAVVNSMLSRHGYGK